MGIKRKFLVSSVTLLVSFAYLLNWSFLDVKLENEYSTVYAENDGVTTDDGGVITDDDDVTTDSGGAILENGTFGSGISNNETVFPYNKLFGITAYYSPLPGQQHYVTGSYGGDIRLNGNGTNGADGTPVYAGMVAAPKTYPFGMKLYIPGIGMTAVHDRGGAIVPAASEDGSGPKHDRLDMWMGYGDRGLQRALDWGFRTVEVTVYGIDDSIQEQVEIAGYSEDEKYNQEYFYIPEYENSVSSPVETKSINIKEALFPEDLWYLSQGDGVKKLQEYLTQLGYFNGIANGYFGDDTRMAIYVFQKDEGIVQDITELGAGHFGSVTRKALEDAILSKKQEFFPKVTLSINSDDKDAITKLQKALKLIGYDVSVTGKYDSKTVDAVLKFQTDNKIVNGDSDLGAGYFGPKTMTTLTAKLNDLFKDGKVKIIVAHADDEIGIMITSKQVLTPPMNTDLKSGDSGPEVSRLQAELRNLNLLRIDPTGTYEDVTRHAVFKFQQRYGLVGDEASEFAGIFGPQTRQKLNEIIASKNYYNKKIAEKRVNKTEQDVVASNN